jgi:hypothetical protein
MWQNPLSLWSYYVPALFLCKVFSKITGEEKRLPQIDTSDEIHVILSSKNSLGLLLNNVNNFRVDFTLRGLLMPNEVRLP